MELRDASLFTPDYVQALHHGGAVPTLAVYPQRPPVSEQLARLSTPQGGPLVVRWMLRPDHAYQAARDAFSPFNRLCVSDPDSPAEVVEAIRAALAADRDVYVIANNKAEGSSPLSLARLAKALIAD